MSTIEDSKKYIFDLYKNSSYLDINSPLIIIIFFLILSLLLFICYVNVVINAIPIKNDWENKKCNPTIMPFAGIINKPDDKTILEFTSENYNQCMKNIVKDVSEYELSPFYYILSQVTSLYTSFLAIIQNMRKYLAFIIDQFKSITLFIFFKFLNVNISFQKLLSNIINVNGKFQAIFMSAAYLLNAGIYLFRSLITIVLNGVLKIIISMGTTIALLMATMLYPLALALLPPYLYLSIVSELISKVLSMVLRIKLKL